MPDPEEELGENFIGRVAKDFFEEHPVDTGGEAALSGDSGAGSLPAPPVARNARKFVLIGFHSDEVLVGSDIPDGESRVLGHADGGAFGVDQPGNTPALRVTRHGDSVGLEAYDQYSGTFRQETPDWSRDGVRRDGVEFLPSGEIRLQAQGVVLDYGEATTVRQFIVDRLHGGSRPLIDIPDIDDDDLVNGRLEDLLNRDPNLLREFVGRLSPTHEPMQIGLMLRDFHNEAMGGS
jgi:hypothetical protein